MRGPEAWQAGRRQGAGRPAHLVAAVLVEHDQEDRHGDNDADHDHRIQNWVQGSLPQSLRVFCKWSIDSVIKQKPQGLMDILNYMLSKTSFVSQI